LRKTVEKTACKNKHGKKRMGTLEEETTLKVKSKEGQPTSEIRTQPIKNVKSSKSGEASGR